MRWLSWQRGTDMPQGKESAFFDKSSASFGFCGDWRREDIKRTYFWRRGVAVAVLFFVTILVIFYTFEHAPAFKTPKNRKSKRHLEMQAFRQDQDNKMSARDVHIIPEKLSWHLKRGGTNLRPNHGDIGKESGKGIHRYAMGRTQEGRIWPPKPFEATAQKHLSGGEDITIGQTAEEETKFISGLREGLILPIRLKGIYMQSMSKRGNRLEEKFNYSKEINNLMQKGFGSETEDGKRTIKKAFKSRGAPFKLPGEENEKRVKAPKTSPLSLSRRGRPITIFLDFHPKKEAGGRFKKSGQAEKIVDEEENGMMMKLNLYLRKGAPKGRRRKVLERHTGEPFETDNKTAKRKSFGWFSNNKKKRNRPKECSIMGLNPLGKRITAKWKDENGDWIHAKRVAVKYWEKENN